MEMETKEEPPGLKRENPKVIHVLEALKQASHELQENGIHIFAADVNSSAIKALLELETEADSILAADPYLSALSTHLSTLKSIVESLQKFRTKHGLRSFLRQRVSAFELCRVAGSIESEIQAWIDRESTEQVARALNCSPPLSPENETYLIRLIDQFEKRVAEGFNRELQDLVLKLKIFSLLESILIDTNFSKAIRDQCTLAISELIRFNKDVFVGQVLMGQTIRALVSISSITSLRVLCSLIKSIKSPLVDDIESNKEIPKIIRLFTSDDLEIRKMAMNCVLEIGYYGRKEAVDAMMRADLIKILAELQRSELGGDLIDCCGGVEEEEEVQGRRESGDGERAFQETHPFASAVARFAVQVEIGEGLRQREKRAFKQEILKRVREVSVSDAEAATIVAEVLWGSSP